MPMLISDKIKFRSKLMRDREKYNTLGKNTQYKN